MLETYPQELVPLEDGLPRPPKYKRQQSHGSRTCIRGPIRLCRLLALMIMLPCLFILIPLYLRYRVYSGQMYPMSMTDMRLIDSKISTTWCQRQVVRSNASFNAFVVPSDPSLTEDLLSVSMTRELELEDDTKEYWGFYLLKGSSVTVAACTRWPGASLIMIKGYKHLQDCAYIGDDSSEELDELLEAHELGLMPDDIFNAKVNELKKIDGKANDPGAMKRHKAGVSFHDPSHSQNVTSPDTDPVAEVDHDPKELREILERLHAIRQAAKTESLKHYKPPDHLMALPALHRHRDTNVDKDERKWLEFKDIDGVSALEPVPTNNTNSTKEDIVTSQTPHNKEQVTPTIKPTEAVIEVTTTKTKENIEIIKVDEKYVDNPSNKVDNDVVSKSVKSETTTTTEKIEVVEDSNTITEDIDSKEVFEDVLKKLKALGDRGKTVLVKLHDTLGVKNKPEPEVSDIMSKVRGSEEELDHLRQVLIEAIDEAKNKSQRQQKRRDALAAARAKRELMLGQITLEKEFNEDDEPRNYALEEDLEDGHADIHNQVNETTAFDMSNSEFWSSFSSSEEALLECEGLILNLPLTPHSSCVRNASDARSQQASKANALTYRVPANGYYFFVFNSENEVQTNFIRAKFDLQKTRYDVARTKLRECTNSTERCDLSLDIFSSQKVILEVPLSNNDSMWNEQFVIVSECEPRTSIYLFCVIAVPVLIVVFAFQ